MEIVIIGCGAAGGTAAQFARKKNRKARITIFEKSSYPQYSKCALPYTISREIAFSDLIEFSQEWFENEKIELYLNTKVKKIDFEEKFVRAINEEKEYDSLIIATGSRPTAPVEIRGKRVAFLQSIDDAKCIKNMAMRGKKAVIIGGGLIGLEATEALNKIGVDVTVIEFLPEILLTMIDKDLAIIVRKKLDEVKGIKIMTNHEVTAIESNHGCKVFAINKENGEEMVIPADFVVIATGNEPAVELATKCEVENGIVVDERCETTVRDVYAAGDCTQYKDILGRNILVGLGSIAARQGKIAGINAAGGNAVMPSLLNTRVTKIFGIEIAAVGPLSSQIEKAIIGKFSGLSRPKYFSNEEKIFAKVVAKENGELMGAQIIGEGASQRINSLATAIHSKMTLDDFSKIETAYHPSVSSIFTPSSLACEVGLRKKLRKKESGKTPLF